MKNRIWTKAIKESADSLRAKHFFDLLSATSAEGALKKSSAEQARILISLFSGSQSLSALLVAHPDWLASLQPEVLKFPRRKEGLEQEVSSWLPRLLQARNYNTALGQLRSFKQRQMLRIGARDLVRPGNAEEITREISDLADLCLESVWTICREQLTAKFGQPWHQDASGGWRATPGCVLGLGKLGGKELNYSSDVDVIFVYEEEGSVFREPPEPPSNRRSLGSRKSRKNRVAGIHGKPVLTNHQFFNRLAEAFVTEVTRLAPEGMLYRIDLRLRPEGDAGPLSRSLGSYENYYAQWGQTWERMMLIKARKTAGSEGLASEFLEMVQPFRYPRSVNENVLREVAAIKRRIEAEVIKAGELERNVKLGRGGIREIEFVAQMLQLLHAGRQPFLQGSQTLPSLQKVAQYELLSETDARSLSEAYRFLRDLEHRLQMEDNRQTHTLPVERASRERLARLMDFPTLKAFEAMFQEHTREVRKIFDKILNAEVPDAEISSPFPFEFDPAQEEWKKVLANHGFKDIPKAFRVLREFVEGPGYVHVSQRTRDLAFQLLPRLLAMCRGPAEVRNSSKTDEVQLSDPDRVVTRLDSFIASYGARGTLFELWNSNPTIFEMLVLLFDRSEFLAEMAIRSPDLVDELVMGGRLRQRKAAEESLRDLRHGLADADQYQWMRRYHRAELMRIGLRDILGLSDFEQYLGELSALSDGCLQYAFKVIMRKHHLKALPFAIIGLGKLGGQEIDYGSDLDIVFVAPNKGDNVTRLGRLAAEVMQLLSARTEDGIVFQTDARLRPDGEKGLLVNTIGAYEKYYRDRAQLWEVQSLTRVRPIAGDVGVGEAFQSLAAALTNFSKPRLDVTAYAKDWKERIHRMRMRIEKERTPAGKDALAIKTGRGALMDAEFMAQAFCLERGWQEPNTLCALERSSSVGALPRATKLIESYRRLRRVEGILRRWSYEGEIVLPVEPSAYERVAIRCGFKGSEAFRQAITEWRKEIREAYLICFARVDH